MLKMSLKFLYNSQNIIFDDDVIQLLLICLIVRILPINYGEDIVKIKKIFWIF